VDRARERGVGRIRHRRSWRWSIAPHRDAPDEENVSRIRDNDAQHEDKKMLRTIQKLRPKLPRGLKIGAPVLRQICRTDLEGRGIVRRLDRQQTEALRYGKRLYANEHLQKRRRRVVGTIDHRRSEQIPAPCRKQTALARKISVVRNPPDAHGPFRRTCRSRSGAAPAQPTVRPSRSSAA